LCFTGHHWRGRQEGRKPLQISPTDLIFYGGAWSNEPPLFLLSMRLHNTVPVT
jgi:hypothetical protein